MQSFVFWTGIYDRLADLPPTRHTPVDQARFARQAEVGT